MKKSVQVFMLPTGKIVVSPTNNQFIMHLGISNMRDKHLEYRQYFGGMHVENPQHLYFVSNEEIKEGDWAITDIGVTHIGKLLYQHDGSGEFQKIIATTDKSLGLPLIPQSFVEEYVKRNGEIKEVELSTIAEEGIDIFVNRVNEVEVLYSNKLFTTEDAVSIKQTVEEAAVKFADSRVNKEENYWKPKWNAYYEGFIVGAKWHQENGE